MTNQPTSTPALWCVVVTSEDYDAATALHFRQDAKPGLGQIATRVAAECSWENEPTIVDADAQAWLDDNSFTVAQISLVTA